MNNNRRIHDRQLLDKLEALDLIPVDETLWRVCWHNMDPLMGSTAGGRWHPAGSIEGLYTSTTKSFS